MNSTAIFLVILSAGLHAIRNLFTKKARNKEIFVWWYVFFALILFFPVFYAHIEEVYNIQFIAATLIFSGLLHFLDWFSLAKAYKKGDLSHVYPIMRATPALVLIFAVVFLNEVVSLPAVIGIIFVVIGVYMINLKSLSIKEFTYPARRICIDRSVQFAILNLFVMASASIIDKLGVDSVHPLAFVYELVAFGFYSMYTFRKYTWNDCLKEWKGQQKEIVSTGFLELYGYALILVAFTLEKVSYVVGLRQMSIVFAVFLGTSLLKEEQKHIRYIAAGLIFLGVFLISIA